MKKKFRKFFDNEKGQAVVEMALVLPLVIMLLCGILDFGWIYVNQYGVENAAYDGARYASLHVNEYDASSYDNLKTEIEQRVKKNLYGKGDGATVVLNVEPDAVKVEVKYPVKILTFVASTFYGSEYKASSTSVAAK